MSIVNGPKIATMVSAANGDTYGDGDRHQLRTQQGLIQANCISVLALSTPPGSPVNGNTYVVGAAPTGLWAGQANSIAYWAVDPQDGPSITPNIATGAWEFYTPLAGWSVFDNATGLTWRYSGTAWNFTRIASTASLAASATVAVPFAVTYTGTNAPIVNVTAVGGTPAALGSVWVTNTGSAGAWTGFTINVTTSGTQTFNYSVEG
jgi:Protein of unknown function (DUF2793)